MKDLEQLDLRHLWHPFTPMTVWEQEAPLVIERADGNYLYDTDGRAYFDGVSSLWTNVHGHDHPRINQAIKDQLERVAHSTLLGLTTPAPIELAAALTKLVPPNLKRVFYSDSGSTAVEIALKQSFQYWHLVGRQEKRAFVCLEHAYHGDTIGAVSVGGIDLFHQTFGPLLFETHRIPSPHPFRHPLAPDLDAVMASSLEALSKTLERHGDTIAALIVEPLVQGAGGILVHPPGFLAAAASLCKENSVHLIVDEVATGFGRTGKMFACEHEGVEPDFLCLAKGITGGYLPLAATVATEEIFEAFRGSDGDIRTFFHGHTYTGNALGCAAALANLAIFRDDNVISRLEAPIRALTTGLETVAEHRYVGDVRQRGLMVGIELVKDRTNNTPFAAEARMGAVVCRHIRERNVILRPLGDVLVLMPPLSTTITEIENLIEAVVWGLEQIV